MNNLLDFLFKRYHWLLFIALEVVSGVLIFRYNNYHNSVWISSANSVAGAVYDFRSSVTSFFQMGAINEELTARNIYLERRIAKYEDAKSANDAETPEDKSSLEDNSLVKAKIISNSISRPDNLMTINVGRNDGVEPDMGVISGMGIVGVTYLVSDNYSVVIPVLNTRSRVSCTIRGKGYFGYLHWEGTETNMAYLEDVPRHAKFKKGDYIETNGYSAIFPPGILVGKIVGIYNSHDGLSYRLKIHLATDFANLRDVAVVTDRSFIEYGALMRAARDSIMKSGR